MTDETEKTLTPEEHYNWSLNLLVRANEDLVAGSAAQTNVLLEALAHVMLGGLRDALDYSARQARRELDEEVKKQQETLYPGPAFEEDMDRP